MRYLSRFALAVSCLVIPTSLASADEASEERSLNRSRTMVRFQREPAKRIATKSFASVCKKVAPISGFLLKNAYPGHIQKSDPRASGFALVCARSCPRKFPVSVYYSDGALAFRLGYYGRWNGNGQPRAYCGAGGVGTCSVSRVTTNARRSSSGGKRDGKIYIDMGNGSCASAFPGRRNGGV